jgi:hypothetical protein
MVNIHFRAPPILEDFLAIECWNFERLKDVGTKKALVKIGGMAGSMACRTNIHQKKIVKWKQHRGKRWTSCWAQ